MKNKLTMTKTTAQPALGYTHIRELEVVENPALRMAYDEPFYMSKIVTSSGYH